MNYRGGMWEGGDGQDGVEGGEWDNCNSIINKYIFKKKLKSVSFWLFILALGKRKVRAESTCWRTVSFVPKERLDQRGPLHLISLTLINSTAATLRVQMLE